MTGPTEFTLESVRQFMLAHEGRVTNHDLVKHFRAWLTHPIDKDSARQRFKEYVNTLATIQQDNGEKYLILKKQFYPFFEEEEEEEEEPSLLDEVLAGYHQSLYSQEENSSLQPPLKSIYRHPDIDNENVYHPSEVHHSGLPPYRAPPPPPPSSSDDLGLPVVPPDYGLPTRTNFRSPLISDDNPPPPLPRRNDPVDGRRSSVQVSTSPPPLPTKRIIHGSCSSLNSSSTTLSRTPSIEVQTDASKSSLTEEGGDPLPEKDEKISVKERTKTFNRMASEVELTVMRQVSNLGNVKRRNSRATTDRRGSTLGRDDDANSISTLDQTVKQWMIKASIGDYHTMAKLLQEEPRLAQHRDFTNGYTALHWACKHGNLDIAKMLCGNYRVDVNCRSHGGYTPLHLSCQFGNQDVFDLLVKAYGGDPNLRDYSGKKPRQYMVVQDQSSSLSLSSATFKQLKDRRRHRRQASEKNAGILRFGSLSVKVKRTTEAFNNYFYNTDKKTISEDSDKMPPPKFASIKKRKSKRPVDFVRIKSTPVTPADSPVKEEHEDSDSEYGFDSQWSNA